MVIEYDEVVAAMARPSPRRSVTGKSARRVPCDGRHNFALLAGESARLHFVSESATGLRELKKVETTRRITLCAQRLTDERGLDGFTMDDLAEAAEVSRRTLFNYFPGKVDAVLGAAPSSRRPTSPRSAPAARTATCSTTSPSWPGSRSTVRQPDRESLERDRPGAARRAPPAGRRPRALRGRHRASSRRCSSSARAPASAPTRPGCCSASCSPCSTPPSHVLVTEGPERTLVEVFDEQLALARALFS